MTTYLLPLRLPLPLPLPLPRHLQLPLSDPDLSLILSRFRIHHRVDGNGRTRKAKVS
jgi:hypothetical protein